MTVNRKKKRKKENRLLFMCTGLLPGVSPPPPRAVPELEQILAFGECQLFLDDGTYSECIWLF